MRRVGFRITLQPQDVATAASMIVQTREIVLTEPGSGGRKRRDWQELEQRSAKQVERLHGVFNALDLPSPSPETDIRVQANIAEQCEWSEALLDDITAELDDLQNRRTDLRASIARRQQWCQELEMLKAIPLPLGRLNNARHLHITVGFAPPDELAQFKLPMTRSAFVVVPLAGGTEYRQPVVAISLIENKQVLEQILSDLFMTPTSFSKELVEVPECEMQKMRAALRADEQQLRELDREHTDLKNQWRPHLDELFQRAQLTNGMAALVCKYGWPGEACFSFTGSAERKSAFELFDHLRERAIGPLAITVTEVAENRKRVA